jgi:hypothetical protein
MADDSAYLQIETPMDKHAKPQIHEPLFPFGKIGCLLSHCRKNHHQQTNR